jgi:hypothetical protein
MFRNILQRGINAELPPSELASQILTLINCSTASDEPRHDSSLGVMSTVVVGAKSRGQKLQVNHFEEFLVI